MLAIDEKELVCMGMKKRMAFSSVLGVAILIGILVSVKTYAVSEDIQEYQEKSDMYTSEEKQKVKDWLVEHGYPPTWEGLSAAYEDYQNGKVEVEGADISAIMNSDNEKLTDSPDVPQENSKDEVSVDSSVEGDMQWNSSVENEMVVDESDTDTLTETEVEKQEIIQYMVTDGKNHITREITEEEAQRIEEENSKINYTLRYLRILFLIVGVMAAFLGSYLIADIWKNRKKCKLD